METNEIIMLVILGALVMIVFEKLAPYFQNKQLTERPRDAHQMLFKKYKKAGQMNKPRALKRLSIQGDKHFPPVYIGRIVGLVQAPEVTQIFFRSRLGAMARWAIIPTFMHSHSHGQELVIYANGLSPVGNFYEPAYPKNFTTEQVRAARKLIDDYEFYMITREENIELTEQKVNAEFIAVSSKPGRRELITRDDVLPSRASTDGRENDE